MVGADQSDERTESNDDEPRLHLRLHSKRIKFTLDAASWGVIFLIAAIIFGVSIWRMFGLGDFDGHGNYQPPRPTPNDVR